MLDASRSRKRPAKFASDEQLQILEAAFQQCSFPDKDAKAMLARNTGLGLTWVSDWFHRRRRRSRPKRMSSPQGSSSSRGTADHPSPKAFSDTSCFRVYLGLRSEPSSHKEASAPSLVQLQEVLEQPSSTSGGTPSSQTASPLVDATPLERESHQSGPTSDVAPSKTVPQTQSSAAEEEMLPGIQQTSAFGSSSNGDLTSATHLESSGSLSRSPSLGYIPAALPTFEFSPGLPEDNLPVTLDAPLRNSQRLVPDPTVYHPELSPGVSAAFKSSEAYTQLNDVHLSPLHCHDGSAHHSVPEPYYVHAFTHVNDGGLGSFSSSGFQTRSTSVQASSSFGSRSSQALPLSFKVKLRDLNAHHNAMIELHRLHWHPHSGGDDWLTPSVGQVPNFGSTLPYMHQDYDDDPFLSPHGACNPTSIPPSQHDKENMQVSMALYET